MDILKILSTFYSDQSWTLVGEEYEGLDWDEDNAQSKPTLEELQEKWDNHRSKIDDADVQLVRQKEILISWPIEKQFEAITEFHMDRPEKMEELIAFIESVKGKHPKATS